MGTKLALVVAAALTLLTLACGGGSVGTSPPSGPPACLEPPGQPPGCFIPVPGDIYIDRNPIFVANAGSSSISAFQNPGPQVPLGLVCCSPFPVSAPPTRLYGGGSLLALSEPAKSISTFKFDSLTSMLTGPVQTLSTSGSPVAAAGSGNWLYVANAEGTVSVYTTSCQGATCTIGGQIPGSPFPAGSSPSDVASAYAGGHSYLYVPNSGSNDISAYILDPSTGVPTALANSPFPAGTNPSSIRVTNLDPVYGGLALAVVTNAGSNNVSVYTIGDDGSLTAVAGSPFAAGSAPSSVVTDTGIYPTHFFFVANANSNDVSVFSVDDNTGALAPAAGSPFPSGGTDPASMTVGGLGFVGFGGLTGPYLYLVNAGSNDISIFVADPNTGAVKPVPGSPFAVGKSPQSVVYIEVPK